MEDQDLKRYLESIIKKCESLTFYQKTKDLWSLPEIATYFRRLKMDDSTRYILSLISSKDSKILIIGGGIGRLGRVIAHNYQNIFVTEIDLSEDMVEQANVIAKDENLKNFKSTLGNILSIDFPAKTFDLVIAYGVFRFLDDQEYHIAISEIERVSQNKYIIAEPALKNILNSVSSIVGIHIEEVDISMTRISFFYMLFREYHDNQSFKIVIDKKTDNNSDFIDILTQIAGEKFGKLYTVKNFS